MTLSMRNLVEPGSTRLHSLLITISRKPKAILPLRGRISSRSSGQALFKWSLDFPLGLPGATLPPLLECTWCPIISHQPFGQAAKREPGLHYTLYGSPLRRPGHDTRRSLSHDAARPADQRRRAKAILSRRGE